MEVVARGFIVISVIQAVVCQVPTLNQQPITQYVLSNIGPNGPQYGPNAPHYRSNGPQIVQNSNLPSSLSNLAATVATAPQKPALVSNPEVTSGPLNSNVLNNLAIALQLLIVSNILNIPSEPEKVIPNLAKLSVPKYELSSPVYSTVPSVLEQALSKPSLYSYEAQSKPTLYSYEAQSKPNLLSYGVQSLAKPGLYSHETQMLPNANFLGSSGFSDPVFGPSVGTARPNPRSSMTLMSPYDALGTSSFADPLSSFPSTYSKKDFQSPYASILAADGARDLFSISDLF